AAVAPVLGRLSHPAALSPVLRTIAPARVRASGARARRHALQPAADPLGMVAAPLLAGARVAELDVRAAAHRESFRDRRVHAGRAGDVVLDGPDVEHAADRAPVAVARGVAYARRTGARW